MQLFGYELWKKAEPKQELTTFNIDRETTSEVVVPESYYNDHAGVMSVPYELLQTPSDEAELIRSYRDLATSAEVDEALQEIRNEVFIFDVPGKKAIELDFVKESKLSASLKKKIAAEFDEVYKITDFDVNGAQWFDDWYVDSKIYLYKMVDYNRLKQGIQKVQFIDPLKIRLVRVMPKPNQDGTYDASKIKQFYLYSNFDPKAHPLNQVIQLQQGTAIQGIQIRPESITYVNSGLFDRNIGRYVGYLKKSIVPYNMLKMMEDAMIIFRVVRAPARRAFYVDVSGLQKNKAEAYIKDLMAKFKNKMVYDSKTGTLSDKRNIMTMLEDYWLPRREGKSTEVTTIEGQNSQDIMDEIEYLRDKFWRSLGVPRSRFGDQQAPNLFGKGNEITRDEYRFTKFLHTLRSRFVPVLEDILRTNLLLKKIITDADWNDIKRDIVWNYTEDNTFVEAKETELLNNRLNTLNTIDPHVGKYFSKLYVQKNVLRMSDKEIAEEDKQLEKEHAAGIHDDPDAEGEGNNGAQFSGAAPAQSDDGEEQEFADIQPGDNPFPYDANQGAA
ncbi:portal head vertex protein [Xanthomonas phage BUDD]|nr:portal head vertex protein [Xanthomonas phage BUDD]